MQETDKKQYVKIHGIGLDKEGRCRHYHTSLDIAALLCAECRKYYACYSCHDEIEDHPFAATAPEEQYPVLCGSCKRKLTRGEYKQGSCPYCMPVLIHGAAYMKIIILPVGNRKNYGERIRSIRNFGKKFCMLFLFVKKSVILNKVRYN